MSAGHAAKGSACRNRSRAADREGTQGLRGTRLEWAMQRSLQGWAGRNGKQKQKRPSQLSLAVHGLARLHWPPQDHGSVTTRLEPCRREALTRLPVQHLAPLYRLRHRDFCRSRAAAAGSGHHRRSPCSDGGRRLLRRRKMASRPATERSFRARCSTLHPLARLRGMARHAARLARHGGNPR